MSTDALDRRKFLKSGGFVGAGFAAGSLFMWKLKEEPALPTQEKDLTQTKQPKGTLTMSDLSQSTFDTCVGQEFTIEQDGTTHAATLVTVDGKKDDKIETFSIIFEVPGTQVFPQAMYKVRHKEIGSHEYFLVPLGNDGKSTRYEAVFTRLIGEEV